MAEPIIEYHFSYNVPTLKLRQPWSALGALDYDIDAALNLLGEGSAHSFPKFERREWPRWAWPGGYPLFYVCADGELLCSHCACAHIKLTSDPQAEADWRIVAADINYEDEDLYCSHCSAHIESAYGESDEGPEPSDAEALASAGHGTDEDYGSAEYLP